MLKNARGSSMIFVISLAIILNIVFIAVYLTVSKTQKATGEKRLKTSSIMLAEAGKEKLYAGIKQKSFVPSANQRVTVYTDYTIGNGSVTVTCSSNVTVDTVWIESWGKDNASESGVGVVAAITPDINIGSLPVRGAITARTDVEVLGNITVDGRDHDTNWNVIGAGLYGVSSCDSLALSGSAQVGGSNVAPVDKTDTASVWNLITEEGAAVSPGLASPEAFFGVAAGGFDEYKSAMLTTPFHGIVYITNSVGPVDFGDYSSGILIVHNSFKTAEMQLNQGTFKGLIIVDKMSKINGKANILGAVVALGETDVSTFGNGGAIIDYSSYVLNNLGDYCDNIKKKVTEVSWRELKKKG